MGSSTKKKKEKKKDFQKPKLRVGKTKAKPANFTDTSFKSKGTSIPQSAAAWLLETASVTNYGIPFDRALTKRSYCSP